MKYVLDIFQIVYRDIDGIAAYIAADRPSAAQKVKNKIFDAIANLESGARLCPELRKKFGVDTDLRMSIVKPYLILYKIDGDIVKVYRVLDGRGDYLVALGLKERVSDDGKE
jgi:plasmid stabilization system protein ParE